MSRKVKEPETKPTPPTTSCGDCISYPKGGKGRGDCVTFGVFVNARTQGRPCFRPWPTRTNQPA